MNVTDDGSVRYGYKSWLFHYHYQGRDRVAFAGTGFGNQRPIVLPELDLVMVFNEWNILPDRRFLRAKDAIDRVLTAVKEP